MLKHQISYTMRLAFFLALTILQLAFIHGNDEDKSRNICHLPADPGPCMALIKRFFYNKDAKKCEEFTYGGCKGNANNFKTLEECSKRCHG